MFFEIRCWTPELSHQSGNRNSPVLVAQEGEINMSGVSNSKIAALIEWLVITFATIIKLIRDGKRSEQDLELLKTAMQAIIDGKCKFTFLILNSKALKGLATSLDPIKIHLAWAQLYERWSIGYPVEPVSYDSNRIKIERGRGRILIYLAPELSTEEALIELNKLFPEAEIMKEMMRRTKNIGGQCGWMFVERTLKMPNTNTTQTDLELIFTNQCAKGMTLNTYVVFGQFCKEIFSRYPDTGGRVRLLGSFCVWGGDWGGKSIIDTSYRRDGSLRGTVGLFSYASKFCLGGRSVTQ